jgi:hypothetical protein
VATAAGSTAAEVKTTPAESNTTATRSPPAKRPTASAPACSRQLGGFLSELDHLRKSLVIGVSYEQYVAELGTVRRTYAKVPVDALSFSCLSGPATAGEESFDGYLAAANVWGDCVSEAGCETPGLEPRLQREWRDAARHLRAAQRGAEEGRS